MAYKCPRCGSEFDGITNLKSHLSRKKICISTLQDIAIEDIIAKDCKTNEKFECTFCNNNFSTNFNLEKHMKICGSGTAEYLKQQIKEKEKQFKEKEKQIKEQLKQINEKDKQINEKDKQIEQLIQKAGNTTINNTIVLLSFDNADRSHLTDEKNYYLLSRKFMAIPYLVKEIYFNPNVPQNHNIKLTNLRDNLISLHVDNKWIKTDKNEVIEKLLDSNERYLENWANDSVDQYPDAIEKFQSYLEIKENDEKSDEKLKRELELLIFNKGKIYI
jgi:hypothetical protein